MADNSNNQQQSDPPPKKGRGATKLRDIVVRQGTNVPPIRVEFDDDINPIGEVGATFISYVGFVARKRISILDNDWRVVKEDIKDQCWSDILQNFDVPNTKLFRDFWLGEVRKRWKNFKTNLSKDYIRGEKKGQDPCETYSFLDPETWNKFVASRLDPKFQEKSQKQKERSAKNIYKHTMSRGGYKWLEKKLTQKQIAEMEEAVRYDPTIVVKPSPISRHTKWAEGRKTKKGKFVTPEVEAVAKRIDELEQEFTQGSFTPSGRMDILATAIGKPDRPGRVIGEPRNVGLKKYFGCKPQSSVRKESTEDIVAKVRAEIEAKFQEQVAAEVQQQVDAKVAAKIQEALSGQMAEQIRLQIEAQVRASTIQLGLTSQSPKQRQQESDGPSGKDSCNQPLTLEVIREDDSSPTLDDSPDVGEECYLHLDVPLLRPVAKARQFPKASSIHNMPIQEDQIKVSVQTVMENEASAVVPFPDKEVRPLGAAIGSFISWPRRLVHKTPQQSSRRHDPLDLAFQDRYPSLQVLRDMQPGLDHIILTMPPRVVSPDRSYEFGLDGQRDIVEFLKMEELDLAWLELAVMYLHKLCDDLGRTGYRFFSPMALVMRRNFKTKVEERNHFDMMQAYVTYHMSVNRGACYFAPILDDRHWSLAVLCPVAHRIFWFDSVKRTISAEHKSILLTGIQHWHQLEQTNRAFEDVVIQKPRCPMQPTNKECGYYIMKYMYDIIMTGNTGNFSKIYCTNVSFNQEDEIDQIREYIAEFFLSSMMG